jgi:hypothetical protein
MNDKPRDKWISVKKKLPEHMDIVRVKHPTQGDCHVLAFLLRKEVNKKLRENGIDPLQSDEGYDFTRLDIPGVCLEGVTHWIKLGKVKVNEENPIAPIKH